MNIIIKMLVILAVIMAIIFVVLLCGRIREAVWERRRQRRKKLIETQVEDLKTLVHGNIADKSDKIEVFGSQILGTRSDQQDSYYMSGSGEFDLIKKSYVAAAVCDGMGGLSSGEAAGKIAVNCIKNGYESFIRKDDKSDVPAFLREIVLNANNAVNKYGKENCGNEMCGTTMSLVFLVNNYMYWTSVGDSRIYIIRDDQIIQITNDHNYMYILNQKIKEGTMTREEAMNEPNKEALISFIGMNELDIIDLSQTPFTLLPGDIVLICSDGLTKVMTDTEICEYVRGMSGNPKELAENLPIVAFDKNDGSQDNTTVVVISYR